MFLRTEHRRSDFVGHHSDLWTLGSTLLCKSTALLSLLPIRVVFLETIVLCNYFHSAMYKHQKFRNRTARRRNTPLAPWAPCTHRARGLSRPPSLRSMSLHPQNRNALLQLSFGPTGHVSKRTTSSWVTLHTNGPKLSTSFEKKKWAKYPFSFMHTHVMEIISKVSLIYAIISIMCSNLIRQLYNMSVTPLSQIFSIQKQHDYLFVILFKESDRWNILSLKISALKYTKNIYIKW